jgi:quercetin dioxygenase-like cupin family protein
MDGEVSYEIVEFNATVNLPAFIDPTPVALREDVTALAEYLKDFPQEDIPVQHEFLDGVYMRTVFMKAGDIIIGKIHKQEHVAIISQGRATVLTEHGTLEIKAPYLFKSPPGVRRALLIHEDMIWTTVHRSDHKDLESLEEQLIAKDFNDPILVELEQKARLLK